MWCTPAGRRIAGGPAVYVPAVAVHTGHHPAVWVVSIAYSTVLNYNPSTRNPYTMAQPHYGPCAGHVRRRGLSSDFYDHLALCVPLFDVGQSFRGRFEWKDPVYNGTNSTGIDERAELA